MDVKFVNTTSSRLNSLSISNGQLIALSDKPGLYYDINNTRRNVTPITLSDSYKSSAGTASGRVGASSYALATSHNALDQKIDEKIKVLALGDHSSADATAIICTIPLKKGYNYIWPSIYEKSGGVTAGDFVYSTDPSEWHRSCEWGRFTLQADTNLQLISGTSTPVTYTGIQCVVLHHDFPE